MFGGDAAFGYITLTTCLK